MPRPKKNKKTESTAPEPILELDCAVESYMKRFPSKTKAVYELAHKINVTPNLIFMYGKSRKPSDNVARALAMEALGARVTVEWNEPSSENFRELSDSYREKLSALGWNVIITPPDSEKQD